MTTTAPNNIPVLSDDVVRIYQVLMTDENGKDNEFNVSLSYPFADAQVTGRDHPETLADVKRRALKMQVKLGIAGEFKSATFIRERLIHRSKAKGHGRGGQN